MSIEARLRDLGLDLPAPNVVPEGVHLPFAFVNVRGDRAYISGHPESGADGSIIGPYGKLGSDLTLDEGRRAARGIALSMLSSLRHELGSLDRITGWNRVFGMVNSAPDFVDQHNVISGCSDLIVDVFGADIGRHARSAIGVAALPMNFAIEIEAEVTIA